MSGNGDRTVSWGALVLPTTTSDRELPKPSRQLSSDPGDSRHWDPSWAALGRWSVLKDLEKAEDLILTVSLDLETRQLTRERGTDQSGVGDFPVANNTAACSRLKVQWPESCTACHSQKLQPLPRNVSACPNSPEAGYGGTVVRVQSCFCKARNTALSVLYCTQVIHLISQTPHRPRDDWWNRGSHFSPPRSQLCSGSAPPASPPELRWDHTLTGVCSAYCLTPNKRKKNSALSNKRCIPVTVRGK